jgi:beta-glucosidase
MMRRSAPAALALAAVIAGPAWSAPAKKLSAFDPEVNALLGTMTLAEKVGQMTQAELGVLKDESDVETLSLGSVFSGGDSDPKTNSMQDWRDMYDRLQAHTAKSRLKIPILYGLDAVHGHSNVLGAVMFPHNVGLGATRDPALVEEIGRVTAREVRATGTQWTFAPCIATVRDIRWGRTYESFGEDPALVGELGAAAVRGLQGDDLKDPLRVLACAKHYAGDGGTAFGTGFVPNPATPGKNYPLDQGDVKMSEADFRKIHLPQYVKSVEAGAGSIMPSYNSFNGLKMSGHKYLLTDVLKKEMGFEGFLISDYNAIDALAPGDYRTAVKLSINAGMDMVMVTDKYRTFITHLTDLAEKGEVPMERIDDAVRRILRVKFAMGLMDEKTRVLTADRKLEAGFGSAEHRAVARRAVRQSLVLLKNDKKTLPLSKSAKRIVVAGSNADDVGAQCGGWTITWQGKSGTPTPGGTSILAAMKAAAPKAEITYSADGSGAAGADVAVVVVGEKPYAEFQGDRTDLSLEKADQDAIANAKKAGVPVVVVVVSGRPMVLGEAVNTADAIVAAWLPGTEGAGVADVLFGDYKPTGKLSFSWPRSSDQTTVHPGDPGYDPQFAYGFGLSY